MRHEGGEVDPRGREGGLRGGPDRLRVEACGEVRGAAPAVSSEGASGVTTIAAPTTISGSANENGLGAPPVSAISIAARPRAS